MSVKKKKPKTSARRINTVQSHYQSGNLTCEQAWGGKQKKIIFCLPFEKPCRLDIKSFWLLMILERTIN